MLTSPIHVHERSSLSQVTQQTHGVTCREIGGHGTMSRRDGQRPVTVESLIHLGVICIPR